MKTFLAFAIAVLIVGSALAQNRRARLYEIASSKTIRNVNKSDVRAALKVWVELIAQQKGFSLDSKVDIVDTVGEITERLQNNTVDVMVVTVTEYLELESLHSVVPMFTSARGAQGNAAFAYVLAVKPSSGISSLAGLRGKRVFLASRTGENTGLAWLDVLLSKEKLGRATSYFSSVKLVDKAQACVLPLFFGTVDACVVDEINLNLAKELNPQLDQLEVLARSRPMIEGVIATPIKPYPYHKELMETLLSLNKDTRGRQVLMVFKTDRLVPLQSSDLDSSRDLWKDYYRLPGAIANTPPGAPSPAAKGFHEKERF